MFLGDRSWCGPRCYCNGVDLPSDAFDHANRRFNTPFSYTVNRPSATLNNPQRPRKARWGRAKCSTARRARTLSSKLMIDMPIIEPTPELLLEYPGGCGTVS